MTASVITVVKNGTVILQIFTGDKIKRIKTHSGKDKAIYFHL